MDENTLSKEMLKAIALGESLSWSNAYSKRLAMPGWLTRIAGEMGMKHYRDGISSPVVPFSLNRNPEPLRQGAADLSEWALWFYRLLVKNEGALTKSVLDEAWLALSSGEEKPKGRLSLINTLSNMSRNIGTPKCGRYNPHYFDDACLPTAIMIGSFLRDDTDEVLRMAELSISYTNYAEGLDAGKAAALASGLAAGGRTADDMIAAVQEYLSGDSPVSRSLDRALSLADSAADDLSFALDLGRHITESTYSYGNIAHEILSCSLAIVRRTKGDIGRSLPLSACVPRSGSGLTALTAALSLPYSVPLSDHPIFKEPLGGDFVPAVRGLKLNDPLADL